MIKIQVINEKNPLHGQIFEVVEAGKHHYQIRDVEWAVSDLISRDDCRVIPDYVISSTTPLPGPHLAIWPVADNDRKLGQRYLIQTGFDQWETVIWQSGGYSMDGTSFPSNLPAYTMPIQILCKFLE